MTESRLYAELNQMFAGNEPVLLLLKRVMAAHLTWDEFLQMRLPD
jgi:hypothetical protein